MPKKKNNSEEVVVHEENKLAVIIQESGLEETKGQVMLEKFSGFFDMAARLEKQAKDIVVTSPNQIAEMKMARSLRLFLREKRLEVENTRKRLKEQAIREGRAIDGIANVLKALFQPIEDYLNEQEHYVELQRKREEERWLAEKREQEEKERLKREEAERQEAIRIRKENERLQKEKKAIEEKARKEREKAEKARLEQERKAREEREALLREQREKEEKARKEREEIERQREAEKKKREEAEKRLRSMITCPNCGHKFIPGE